jgi:hypothetical protein
VLLGGASEALAQTGTISGTITGSDTLLGLPNADVWIFNLNSNGDTADAIVTTNGSGFYTATLPPGAYAVYTQNRSGYINEAWDNHPCSAVCDLETVDEIIVTNGSSSVANFVLDPGGRVSGRITDSVTGLGIAGVRVMFWTGDGGFFWSFAITDANGDYVSEGGTVTGIVYAQTMNTLGYQNEVWDNVKCGGEGCDASEIGTAINVTLGVTTGGIDFALDIGGFITGTVRDENGVPLVNVSVRVYDTTGEHIEDASTDASGNYKTGGLVSGTYYVGTENALGLVDKVWNGVPCLNGGFCDPRSGAPVAVTLGEETPDIDFVLTPGGRILGTVTNAATGQPIPLNLFVGLNDASGQFIGGANTDRDTGNYPMRGVPPGTYYASIFGPPGFFNQMYNNLTCTTNCNILQSTPIHVTAGVDTININFALQPTTAVGAISGTVRDVGTAGSPVIATLNVQLLSATGAVIANMNTNASGVYTFSNLAVGSYYVRANPSNQPFIGMLHGSPVDVVCLNCNVLTTAGGALVPVTVGGTTTVDFNLTAGGRISGTVTNAVGGAPLSGIQIQVFSDAGVNLGQTSSGSPSGTFTTRGLPNGTYYLRAMDPAGNFVGKLFDNIFCPGPGCSVTNGTPIVVAGTGTVTNRNFQLAASGKISGTVTGPPGLTIQFGTSVFVYTETGVFLGNTPLSDAAGNYTSFGLPAGRYFIRTSNSLALIDEIYDDIPCIGNCSPTAGTPIDVTVGGTASGRNFTLARGGNIAGTVRDAVTTSPLGGIRVSAYLADGTLVKSAATNANGEYAIVGLEAGTYYVRTVNLSGSLFYLDELYNELPCAPTCTLTDGAPVVVVAGVTEGGRNFTLSPGGGAISGTIRDAATNAVLGGIPVQVYLSNGTLVKTGATTGLGQFQFSLPAGTYYVRTAVSNPGAYLDELYNQLPCTPTCNVTAGAAVIVVNGATQGGVDFTLAPNLVKNGRFESGTTNWIRFATPDMTYIVSQITNGVFEYYRVAPPPGTTNQAVVYQETGVALPNGAPVIARFSLGNSSSVRKRISVLVLDSDFSDLSVCTFWLPPLSPVRAYQMRTHSTKAWANTAIYFYAATAGSNGGFYQLDDVSIEYAPDESNAETNCVDPSAPAATVGVGPEMLVNGNFDTGVLTPWFTFGQISGQVTGGVFEFIKLAGTPAGVVAQLTGQAAPGGTILTATFQLGNSSAVRKRVTVILSDSSFLDLSACTFWLPPGLPLSTYTYRTYTTQAWTNAQLSVYPATTGADQWIRLDNVSLRTTQGTAIVGTECIEPGGSVAPSASIARAIGSAFITGGGAASAGGEAGGPQVVQGALALDLTSASSATLAFGSWLAAAESWGELQVRGRDGEWTTLRVIKASEDWAPIVVDLADYLGQVVDVRLVFYATGGAPGIWRVGEIAIDVRR